MDVSANRFQLVSHNPALQGQAHLTANSRFALAHSHSFGDSIHFGADENKDKTEPPKDNTAPTVDNKEDQKPENTGENKETPEQKPADNKPAEPASTSAPATPTIKNLEAFLQGKADLKKEDAGETPKVAAAAFEFLKTNHSEWLSADEKSTDPVKQLEAAVLKDAKADNTTPAPDVSSPEKVLEATAKLLQKHKVLDPAKLTAGEKTGFLSGFGKVGWGGVISLVAGGLALGPLFPLGVGLLLIGAACTIYGLVKGLQAKKEAGMQATEKEKTEKTEPK